MGLYGMVYEFVGIFAACYIVVDFIFPGFELPLVALAMGWTLGGVITHSKLIKEITG